MKTQIFPINEMTPQELSQVVRGIENGAVAALATDTVYGIAANAFNEKAVQHIYRLKQRPAGMALQILVGSVSAARQIVAWDERADKLAQTYWPGALTMILPPNEKGQSLRRGFEGLGLRVPNHAGLLRLLSKLSIPLACTSANIHGHRVITKEKDLIEFCDEKVDFILTDGTLSPVASSVIDLTVQPAVLLREGALLRADLERVLKVKLK